MLFGSFWCFIIFLYVGRPLPPPPPNIRAFWCFSCFLVLFRDWYVYAWMTKHQKARAFVLFGAFWCFISFLCVGRPLLPPSQYPCFLVLFVLSGAFSWLVCVCVDDKARKSTKKHELSCFLVLYHFPLLVALSSPPSISVLFGAFRAFSWLLCVCVDDKAR